MFTIGTQPGVKMTHADDNCIALSFPSATALEKGTVVKLGTNGKVAKCAAVTDVPIGVVVTPASAADVPVTVMTHFLAVGPAQADGAVAIGNQLACSGHIDGVGPDLKVAVATNYVVAVALTGASDNGAITAGFLRTTYKFA